MMIMKIGKEVSSFLKDVEADGQTCSGPLTSNLKLQLKGDISQTQTSFGIITEIFQSISSGLGVEQA